MNLEVVKLHPQATVPNYANPLDAGLDLFAINTTVIAPGETKLIKTGIAIALPSNTEAQIRPRSGLALKHSITVLNSPGTIDAGYRGEIGIILINHGQSSFKVMPKMKIAQMVIAPIVRVNITVARELEESIRGTKGFGSTGKM